MRPLSSQPKLSSLTIGSFLRRAPRGVLPTPQKVARRQSPRLYQAAHTLHTALHQGMLAVLDAPDQAMLASQSGPLTDRTFTTMPLRHMTYPSHLYRVLLRPLRLPLPFSEVTCLCCRGCLRATQRILGEDRELQCQKHQKPFLPTCPPSPCSPLTTWTGTRRSSTSLASQSQLERNLAPTVFSDAAALFHPTPATNVAARVQLAGNTTKTWKTFFPSKFAFSLRHGVSEDYIEYPCCKKFIVNDFVGVRLVTSLGGRRCHVASDQRIYILQRYAYSRN